jgi:hypothetical protein
MTESLLLALDQFSGPDGTAPSYHPTEAGRELLLRATDHLRNLGHRGELLTLRDRLMLSGDIEGHRHQLHFVDGRPHEVFLHYSTPYAVSDRLVSNGGDELRVARIKSDGGFMVEPWVAPVD